LIQGVQKPISSGATLPSPQRGRFGAQVAEPGAQYGSQRQ
jgi:hypothetical protein